MKKSRGRSAKQERIAMDKTNVQAAVHWLIGTPGARKRLGEYLTIGSSVGTAVVAIVAGLKYIFGFFSPIELQIELPPIIEFRCSDTEFDAQRCSQGTYLSLYHTTIAAALNVRAVGESTKEATIMSALAVLHTGPAAESTYTLTWNWTGDFVAGQPFQRKQVTVISLKGGETRSEEMWFFPLQKPCGPLTRKECEEKERHDFLPWATFIAQMQTSEDGPLNKSAYKVDFLFKYREGDAKEEGQEDHLRGGALEHRHADD